jgi:uncharacterized protein YlxP (DUF503 family)
MNENGSISFLTLELEIPGCKSLKEKRSILQPLIAHLRKAFNVSVSEIAHQDSWDQAGLGVVIVSNDGRYNQKVMAEILNIISSHYLNINVVQSKIESR